MTSHYEDIYSVSDDDNDDDEEEEIEEEEENNSEECNKIQEGRNKGRLIIEFFSRNKIIDPRAQWVQEWNRVFLLVCAIGLFLDPLFFYALSISENCMCLFVDGWFAVTVTALRCMTDALHVWNMWLQFKMINRSRRNHMVAQPYFKAKKGFLFDLFVILPLPQVSLFYSFLTSYVPRTL